jgi:hypothetical protein
VKGRQRRDDPTWATISRTGSTTRWSSTTAYDNYSKPLHWSIALPQRRSGAPSPCLSVRAARDHSAVVARSINLGRCFRGWRLIPASCSEAGRCAPGCGSSASWRRLRLQVVSGAREPAGSPRNRTSHAARHLSARRTRLYRENNRRPWAAAPHPPRAPCRGKAAAIRLKPARRSWRVASFPRSGRPPYAGKYRIDRQPQHSPSENVVQ